MIYFALLYWQAFNIVPNRRSDKKLIGIVVLNSQLTVADPGFPRGGGANPKGGAPTLFGQFFPKTAWKWRNFGPEGGARVPRAPPLDPPLAKSTSLQEDDKHHCSQYFYQTVQILHNVHYKHLKQEVQKHQIA